MNCPSVQEALIAFLDDELPAAEHAAIRRHLAGCADCQRTLAALQATREMVHATLRARADQAVPSPLAWERLQARLPQPAPVSVYRAFIHPFQGAVTMRKAFVFSTLLAVITLATAAIFTFRDTSGVSAQDILDHAYNAQHAQVEGIQHTRTEKYNHIDKSAEGLTLSDTETRTFIESYLDPQAKKFRSVITEADTNRVLYASAFDGTAVFSSDQSEPGDVLTVYRTTLGAQEVADTIPATFNDTQAIFEAARRDPVVKFVGEETWIDGRSVQVLRSDSAAPTTGYNLLYFDAETYKLLETRLMLTVDGEAVIAQYDRVLIDEILPADAPVVWDLSDVAGLQIVEDTTGEHADLLPTTITGEELAARDASVYLLTPTPDGFEMQIQVSQPKNEEPVTYFITYRNAAGQYLVLQQPSVAPGNLADQVVETMTTASGLTLSFLSVPDEARNLMFSTALVQTPDGIVLDLTSSLPLDQVKALAETLAVAP
jgi:hypothetical protein